MDADPNSQTRPVELTGTAEQISRAEELINEVLAEVLSKSLCIVYLFGRLLLVFGWPFF